MQRLEALGIHPKKRVFWNTVSPVLVEHTLLRGEGLLAHHGPLVVDTTPYTGRSPKDKFVVREPEVEGEIWWGEVNQPFAPEAFEALYQRVVQYLSERDLYVQDLYAGADRRYRLAVRVVTESPWHALFARNMFILPAASATTTRWRPSSPASPWSTPPTSRRCPKGTARGARCSWGSASRGGSSSSWAPSTPGRSRRASSPS